jgi:hypothetical protein
MNRWLRSAWRAASWRTSAGLIVLADTCTVRFGSRLSSTPCSPHPISSTAASSASIVITASPRQASPGWERDAGARGRERLGPGGRAVVDHDAVTRPQQRAHHRCTHVSETDDSDVHDRSGCKPEVGPILLRRRFDVGNLMSGCN